VSVLFFEDLRHFPFGALNLSCKVHLKLVNDIRKDRLFPSAKETCN